MKGALAANVRAPLSYETIQESSMEGPVYRLVWSDAPAFAVSYETLARALDGVRARYPNAAWKTVHDETLAWVDESAATGRDAPVATIRRLAGQ
jgi:hypothetical protein